MDEFKDVFSDAVHAESERLTPFDSQTIPEAPLPRMTPRRVPPAVLDAMHTLVDRLVAAGIIRRSTSP